MAKIRCPHCLSKDIMPLNDGRKKFSFAKATLGALTFGGYGVVAGLAGKKGKTTFFCNRCNRTFEKKV